MKIKKRGQMWETLIPWIIAIVTLVIVITVYIILGDKGGSALGYIRDLFRFGR
jgi:hypothetical protein